MDSNFTPLSEDLSPGSAAFSREAEPMASSGDILTVPEVLTLSESGKETEPGVEQSEAITIEELREPQIQLDPELEKAGLKKVEGVQTQFSENPISDAKILQGRSKSVNSSWRWLSEGLYFRMKKAGIILKEIRGKVVRILTNKQKH